MTQHHTPGPWRWDGDRNAIVSDGQIDDVYGDGEEMLPRSVISTYSAMSGDDINADARLIAAAPDLLDACREFVGAVDAGTTFSDLSVIEAIRTAITKATGA